ncbi:hypothetical protein TrRE_jg9773, partial [Triparma retinervis]
NSQHGFTKILRNDNQVSSANSSDDAMMKAVHDQLKKTFKRYDAGKQRGEIALKGHETVKKNFANKKKRVREGALSIKNLKEAMTNGKLKVMIGSKLKVYKNKGEQIEHHASLLRRLNQKQAELAALVVAKEDAERDMTLILAKVEESKSSTVALEEGFASLVALVEANKKDQQESSRAIFEVALPKLLARIQTLDFTANQHQDQLDDLRGELAVVKGQVAVNTGLIAEHAR